jgi:predicted transcriptional regulator
VQLFGLRHAVSPRRVKQNDAELLPPSEIRLAFARNLRAAREQAGLSQRELGRLAGFSQKYIWQMETEAMNVTLDVISRLSRALGKRELDLLQPY